MPSSTLSWIGRALRGFWRLLDATRRTLLNLLLLCLLLALAWALLRGGPPALQPKTVLVLDLAGRIAEQRADNGRDNALQRLRGQGDEQARLRDVLAVLEAAAKDDKVGQALLVLDNLGPVGLPTLREMAAAIDRFKAAGKPVVAWGSEFDQRQYFLAAHANEVWLHPMGAVFIEGYGRYRSYYKDLLDKVGVSANVLRVGKFKNAAETYAANAPSPETLEADGALYGALWASWTGNVEAARKLPAGSIAQAIESLPASLVAAGGDGARWALERKWVDGLKTRDEMRALLIERGAKDEANKTFRQVSFGDYLGRIKPRSDGDAVGVVVAEGEIGEGRAGPGRIGGLSTAELIRKAREDDKIKAIVLRVDSPGGSAFGSELVRRELELARSAGKPVVVSMGDVAASGGYWISTASDEIIADETTITGSIGVIAVLPTAQGLLDKVGVHTGGSGTTWLANAYDVRRALDPRFAQLVQASIDHTYFDFTTRVAAARKTTREKIDAVGQGRVWVGKDALARGLIDRTGSFADAIQAAAKRAKLPADVRVQYIEAEPGRLQRLLDSLGVGAEARAWLGTSTALAGPLAALGLVGLAGPAGTGVAQDLGWLADVAERRQPFSAVVHCLCGEP
jgi:protease-4